MRTDARVRRVPRLAALLILLALPIFIGAPFCSKDKGTNPVPIIPPSRTTPSELLTNWFERAYSTQDSVLYEEMLDDAFEFNFLIVDAESLQARGQLPPGQDWWGKTLDLQSTGKMFRSDNVGDITLDILVTTETESTDPECEGCREVDATVTLRVTTNPQAADPRILAVDSPQFFIVKKDPADTTKWVVWKQIDRERT